MMMSLALKNMYVYYELYSGILTISTYFIHQQTTSLVLAISRLRCFF